ncbi:hypothetical protein PVAND_013676 [Polypedilum vanderplanki]|uniref:Steroid 5-alpha reductase C-terminal domain-containing protein n=1 Tax=Polypedilum vanderplanki TaxID=319348 RepID=A0A9J6CQ48_POLVA|nr:hypothetical protein PVAND_013676 [Polypedilum vanderplanki]
MTLLDAGGFLLWIAGFIFETVADYQKFTFRSLPENKGNFMSSGLWAYSRHPNYFGEILLWLGVAISSFSGSKSYSVFISPIFVALLLIFVSGIPALEKKADQLYANNEEYQLYKKNTPVLIPFIGRKGNAEF